jgi:hypothetical protein
MKNAGLFESLRIIRKYTPVTTWRGADTIMIPDSLDCVHIPSIGTTMGRYIGGVQLFVDGTAIRSNLRFPRKNSREDPWEGVANVTVLLYCSMIGEWTCVCDLYWCRASKMGIFENLKRSIALKRGHQAFEDIKQVMDNDYRQAMKEDEDENDDHDKRAVE